METTRYHRVGTQYTGQFLLLETNSPVTGKAASDWTTYVVRNTDVYTNTGVTVTQVSSAQAPGQYALQVNESTGFVGVTGVFGVHLEVTEGTATLRVTDEVVVTSTGDGTGSIGAAEFAAAASNGRVTDGTSPLENATVYFKNASGTVVTSVTTDSDGLYTVWLDETVTGFAQKDGYTQATFTVTVSGSTATGPGTDVVLAVSVAGSTITAQDLWSYYKRQAMNVSGTLADTIVKEDVNDALQMVANDSEWTRLLKVETMEVRGTYQGGTVAISDGSAVVTLTGGTFPSWVAEDDEIRVNNTIFPILSRDSDTQVTLQDIYRGDALTGASYFLYRDAYDLPVDLVQVQNITFRSGWQYSYQVTSYPKFWEYKATAWNNSTYPEVFAIANGKIHFYPAPTSDGNWNLVYKSRISKLTNSADVVDTDLSQEQMLHRAIDVAVAARYGQTMGGLDWEEARRRYKRALTDSVVNDKSAQVRTPNRTGIRYGQLKYRDP